MDWRKKKKRPKREIKGEWPDAKIRKLIYNVEQRAELWDVSNTNHRIPRPESWQELAAELDKNVDWRDCRLKWQNLRVTYKFNLGKIAKRKSETGLDEAPRWRFFDAMKFLEKNEQHATGCNFSSNLNESESKMNFTYSNMEFTNASCSTVMSQHNGDYSQCSSNLVKQESLSTLGVPSPSPPTPPPPPPPLPPPSSYLASTSSQTKTLQEQLVSKVKSKNDEHACFGNFIASELRNLPPEHAFALKRRLNRTLLNYWDEMEEANAKKQTKPVMLSKPEVIENNT